MTLSEAATANLKATLNAQPGSLFAVLDAAREPAVVQALSTATDEWQSLYEGDVKTSLAPFAPYAVRFAPDSPLLESFLVPLWGASVGFYFHARSPLGVVRRHLRRFLMVRLPDGKRVYFRFYDPRVLRVYLHACTAQEAQLFLGPMERLIVEGPDPREVVIFTRTAEALLAEVTRLGEGAG